MIVHELRAAARQDIPMNDLQPTLDVAILGGGPAGCATGIFLARAGLNIAIYEAQRHPKHHIGESLLPGSLPILERVGISRAEMARNFQPKYGARFFDPHRGDAGEMAPFTFAEGETLAGPSPSYQVLRADFDALLSQKARHAGCEFFEHTTVLDIDQDTATFTARSDAGSTPIRARFLVDATGRRAIIASKRGTKVPLTDFGRVAVFNYFADLPPHDASDPQFITMYIFVDATGQRRGGWWWLIPLADGRTSVGVVMQSGALAAGLTSEEQFWSQAKRIPRLFGRLKNARVTEEFRVEADYSFRVDEKVGPHFAIVGDAAGFLDPIFSSGVHLALVSAEQAAAGVVQRLGGGSMDGLKAYQHHMQSGFGVFHAFVQRYYNGGLLNLFFKKDKPEQYRRAIVDILAGNVWDQENPVIKMLKSNSGAPPTS